MRHRCLTFLYPAVGLVPLPEDHLYLTSLVHPWFMPYIVYIFLCVLLSHSPACVPQHFVSVCELIGKLSVLAQQQCVSACVACR